MRRVVVAFLILGVLAGGAYYLTDPTVEAKETVIVEPGDDAVVDIRMSNAGTIHASMVDTGSGPSPYVRLSETEPSPSMTANAVPSGDFRPSLTVEAPEGVEPGEYILEIEAWRLPNRRGEKTVQKVTVIVEENGE